MIPALEPTGKSDILPLTPGTQCKDAGVYLSMLMNPGDVHEIRIPKCPAKRGSSFATTVSGYFSSVVDAAKQAIHWDRAFEPQGTYITINPTSPNLIARSKNLLKEKASHTTTDGDIVHRRWVLIDIDAARPAGISATIGELNAAIKLSSQARQWLTQQGWPAPLRAMSGNGVNLLYRVDLPNDEATTHLISGLLRSLAKRFDAASAHIDTATFNASRIAKVIGTYARKGDDYRVVPDTESSDDRPHRQTYFIVPDGPFEPVSHEQIEAVVALDQPPAIDSPAMKRELASILPGDDRTRDNRIHRCRAYLAKMPPAIEGQNGSGVTLEAAASERESVMPQR